MAQVTILRRGESLDSKLMNKGLKRNDGGGGIENQSVVPCETRSIDPGLEMVPKQVQIPDARAGSLTPPAKAFVWTDMYDASDFPLSPMPRSLPLPSFCKKKMVLVAAAVDNSATRDLRQLLHID